MTDRVSFLNVILKHPVREDDIEGLVNAIKHFSNVMNVEVIKQNVMMEHMMYSKAIGLVSEKIVNNSFKLIDELRKDLTNGIVSNAVEESLTGGV